MGNKTSFVGKLKTFLLVVILSFLIWAFAERAVTTEETVSVTLKLLPSASEDILAQFIDEKGLPIYNSYPVKLTVEGSTSRVHALTEDYLSEIKLDIDKIAPDGQPKEYARAVLDLIGEKLSAKDGKSYLKAIDSEPKNLKFEIIKLVKKEVPVRVYDQENKLLPAKVTPETVLAYVRNDQVIAKVELDNKQRLQSIGTALKTQAVVAPILDRPAQIFDVEVILISNQGLEKQTIPKPRLAIVMPVHMIGKYMVVFGENHEAELGVYDDISCQGTAESLKAYKDSDKHLLLEIFDKDIDQTSIIRAPSYNIPEGADMKITNPKEDTLTFSIKRLDQLPTAANSGGTP
ncbi:MAG: hypothetical protein JEZ07_07900 [Phycisphaerae bacterium]|nr:hypothetical protein [Phycisphaerae bacterium]